MGNKIVEFKPNRDAPEEADLLLATLNRGTFVIRDELQKLVCSIDYLHGTMQEINSTLKQIKTHLQEFPQP